MSKVSPYPGNIVLAQVFVGDDLSLVVEMIVSSRRKFP